MLVQWTEKLERCVSEALNSDEEPDIVALKKHWAELKKIQSILKRFDGEILEYILERDDDVCENEMDDVAEYKEKIVGAEVAIEEKSDSVMEADSIASRRSS
eukprot:gene989-10762_t